MPGLGYCACPMSPHMLKPEGLFAVTLQIVFQQERGERQLLQSPHINFGLSEMYRKFLLLSDLGPKCQIWG